LALRGRFVEGGSYGTGNQGGRISGSEGIFDYSFSVQHLRPSEMTPPMASAP
jgi:vitamin B12 transporter